MDRQLTLNNINITDKLLTVKELLKEVNYEYNELYIDKFWDNIEEDKWIYIDNNTLNWIGYNCNQNKDNKYKFLIFLKEIFEDNKDYKFLTSTEFKKSYIDLKCDIENKEINSHNKTKHLIVSPDCFKQSLMLLKTKKSKEIRKYYVELEKIFKFYLQYQNKYQQNLLEDKDNELKEEKKKNNKYEKMIINQKILTLEEYIYIVSTRNYTKRNISKIGRTNNPSERIKSYNTGRTGYDKFEYIYIFKCNNSKILEKLIFSLLDNYQYIENGKKMNEIYQIDIDYLIRIFKVLENNEINYISNINNITNEYYFNYKNNTTKDFNDIKINNLNKYLCEKFDIIEENKLDKVYENSENKSKLNKDNINKDFISYDIKMINKYGGNSGNPEEFECLTIFKHKSIMTLDHMRRKIQKNGYACSYCTKHGILDQTPIYSYNKDTCIFIKQYKDFKEIKIENPDINFKLIKNNIREKRWLCSVENNIYSILSPDNENKLNLNKELTDMEKKVIKILEIDYTILKSKLKQQYFSFIYIIDNENKEILKSNKTIAEISRNIKYKDGSKPLFSKSITKHIKDGKPYAGYYWTDKLDNSLYLDYKIIEI